MPDIPEMTCLANCGQCCGPVPFTPAEVAAVEGAQPFWNFDWVPLGNSFIPKLALETGNCPFLTTDKECSIHEHRPLICQLFGVVETPKLTCPYGCGPEGEKLSEPMAQLMLKKAGAFG